MLLYHNKSFFRLILERRGSLVFRLSTMVAGIIVAGTSFLLAVLIENKSRWAPKLPHHYGIMSIGGIVAVAVVFRTNQGWQRYWEAMTQQHFMYSKWSDAYTQFHAFAMVSAISAMKKGEKDKVDRINTTVHRVERNFSLLSALAADRLAHGDTNRMERRAQRARWRDQHIMRHELRAGRDIEEATVLPKLISKTKKNTQILDKAWETSFSVTEEPSDVEVELLSVVTDRVGAIMHWIVHDLSQISADLIIAPPIQSRMYQELSNGMLGFNNSMKIADVPFPFPYAQLLQWILVFFVAFIPFYVAVFTESLVLSPIVAFALCTGIWGMNQVAIELENPFGMDKNDISLSDFHARFMDSLLEVGGVYACKVEHEAQVLRMKTQMTFQPSVCASEAVTPAVTATSKSNEPTDKEVGKAGATDSALRPTTTADTAIASEIPLEAARFSVVGKVTSLATPESAAVPKASALTSDELLNPVLDEHSHKNGNVVATVPLPLWSTALREDGDVAVFDKKLMEISTLMEQRLTQILKELEAGNQQMQQSHSGAAAAPKVKHPRITRVRKVSGCVSPAEQKGSPKGGRQNSQEEKMLRPPLIFDSGDEAPSMPFLGTSRPTAPSSFFEDFSS